MKNFNFLSNLGSLSPVVGSSMDRSRLENGSRTRRSLFIMLLVFCTLGVGSVWAEKITNYTNIVSGKKYYIGATTGGTDYYFKADGDITTGTGKSGLAVTSTDNATPVTFTGSGTSWTLQFSNGNYMTLSSSKANGKYESQATSATWTLSNNSNLIQLSINSHALEKNSSTTNFGSYGHSGSHQTRVWLEEVPSEDPSFTITEATNNSTYGTVSLSGNVITASANEGYRIDDDDPYTVTPDGSATVVRGEGNNSNKFTVTPSANTTVTINFEAIPTHKANFSANGTVTSNDVYEGAAIEFPESATGCDGGVFKGWASAAIVGTQDEAPEYVTEATMGNADVTYYAVFATENNSGSSSATLTLDALSLSTPMGSSYSSNDFTYSDLTFGRSNAAIMSSKIQIKSSSSNAVWNKTALSGAITSIKVSPATNSTVLTVGNSVKPSTNSNTVSSEQTYNFDPEDDLRYFMFAATSSYTQVTSVVVTYEESSTTYSDYRTSCCTSIAALNAGAVMTSDQATLTWDAVDGVSLWSVTGKIKNGADIAAANIGEITDAANNKKQCVITGLTPGTNYDFYIHATAFAAGYCTSVDQWTVEGETEALYTFTAVSNNPDLGTVSTEDNVITGAPEANCRYANPAYTVSPANAAAVAQDGNAFTVSSVTANCTITINFEAIPTHKANFSANGTVTSNDVYEGAAIEFPESASGCSGKVFKGWSAVEVEDTNDEPTYVTEATMGNADVTFYAVFARENGGSFTTILTEEFDNDLTSDDSNAYGTSSGQSKPANFTGTCDKAYAGAYGTAKFGSSSAFGYITSKSLDLSSAFSVTLKAKKYGSDAANVYVTVGSETKTVPSSDITSDFKEFTLDFEAATASSTIKIGTSGSGKRAYIDDVVVKTGSPATYSNYSTTCNPQATKPTISPEAGTYTEAQTITITAAEGATIYYSLDGNDPVKEEENKYTEPIVKDTRWTGTVKAIAVEEDKDDSEVASATYTIIPLTSIALSEESFEVYKGQALPKPATVTATYSVGDTEDVTASAVFDSENVYSPTTVGEQTITVSYTEAGKEVTATYTVTVKSIANTIEHPYTIAEARAIIDLDNIAGNDLDLELEANKVYIQGLVVADPTETEIKLQDAPDSDAPLYLYGYTLENDISEVLNGETIKAYGNLYYFTNKSKYEMSDVCQVVAKEEVPVTGVTLDATATVKAGKTITLTAQLQPANASNRNVTWTIKSGAAYASVSAAGVVTGLEEGEAVVKVTTEEGGYTAECTVTVEAGTAFATGDWKLVKDAKELTDGSYVMIVASALDYGMSDYNSSGYFNKTSVEKLEEGEYLQYDENIGVYEIKDYSSYKTFYDEENNRYLALNSSANALNHLTTQEDNSSWTISVTEAGVATITNKSFNTRFIQYNSNRFACYANAQQPIALYKYIAAVPKISFDANAGGDAVTNVPEMLRTDTEGKLTIPATKPERAGYKFLNWNTQADGEGEAKSAGVEYTFTANTTLYAQWEEATALTVTYSANGGTGVAPEPEQYNEGQIVTLKANTYFENPGFTYNGWQVSYVDGNEEVQIIEVENDQFEMPAFNVTVAAQWSRPMDAKFMLVTGLAQLNDGDKVIIVAEEYDKALGAESSTNKYREAMAIEKEGDIIHPTEATSIFTLVGSDGTFAFKGANNKYMYADGDEMKEQAAAFNWTVTINENGTRIAANSTYRIMYNSGSPRFKPYSGSQAEVVIYREVKNAIVTEDDATEANVDDNADVIVEDGGKLTIENDKTLGDVVVENGGEMVVEDNLTVTINDLIIESKKGESAQISGASNLNISGDLFMDVQLCNGDLDADYWYSIAVPFDVDINEGIYKADGTKLTNRTDYEVWGYNTQKRADTQSNGWERVSGKMEAGKAYLIGFNPGMPNVVRLKAAAGWKDNLFSGSEIGLTSASDGTSEGAHSNWNGIANPTLHYIGLSDDVQVFDNNTHTFSSFGSNEYNFVVGTSFFVQQTGAIGIEEADHSQYRAPKRAEEKYSYSVRISKAEAADFDNQIIVRASEEATGEYTQGRDMVTLNNATSKTAAMLWTENYGGKRLAIEEAPIVNNKASYVLGIYAPAAGTYSISVPTVREDATIYLTKNGKVIWNLSMSEYTAEFEQGNNAGYGIRIVRTPQVITGVENTAAVEAGVQKVVIDEHVYILRGEQMFDVTGKSVK